MSNKAKIIVAVVLLAAALGLLAWYFVSGSPERPVVRLDAPTGPAAHIAA